jgi:hypothetical protein
MGASYSSVKRGKAAPGAASLARAFGSSSKITEADEILRSRKDVGAQAAAGIGGAAPIVAAPLVGCIKGEADWLL